MQPNIAFVGEVMIELSGPDDAVTLGVAGDVYNSAVYFKRALPKAEARLVTALGDDPYSNRIAAQARVQGLSATGLRREPGAVCGLYAVDTDAKGERQFTYWRSTSAARSLFSNGTDFAALDGCDLILLTGITLAIIGQNARSDLLDWIVEARQRGLRLAFDSNYRPKLWSSRDEAVQWCEAFWSVSDFAFPSVDDEMSLFGDKDLETVIKRFDRYAVGGGALKAGADGSYLLGPEFTSGNRHVEAQHISQVVDTTAAGDSYNAAFLAAALMGKGPVDCARAGHDLSAKVICHRGAILPATEDA